MSQTFWTIISGVSIFILGQIVINFILKPIQDLYKVIGEISHKVKFHSNVITNSGLKEERIDWAAGDMRDLSCQLESRYVLIPLKGVLANINIIPKKTNIKYAAEALIFLSNSSGKKTFELKNADAIDKLKTNLKINL